MPHIPLPERAPGILGLFAFRPETARPLNELAELLLRAPSTLSRGERELIAAYVSSRNQCVFCTSSHAAFARAQLADGARVVAEVTRDLETASVSAKLKALLRIAGQVQEGGKHVTSDALATARAAGASDREIHDTVLIAAAFCMYNRYVDGLGTVQPTDPETYDTIARDIVANGYRAS
jgi:uncharacterized peroxidase-related enzyme